jgi:hypothetical protein
MNFSGLFSYGNILKTFLPGMLLLTGFVLLIDAYNFYTTDPHTYILLELTAKYPLLSITILASTAIVVGILSNSIYFKWIIPLIGAVFESKNTDFKKFKETMEAEMNEHYSELLSIDPTFHPVKKSGFDVRAFLLNRTDLVALQYLRESYWYYMEFQLNAIGAIIVLYVACIVHMALRLNFKLIQDFYFWPIFTSATVFFLITIIIFSKAAYENYEKHEKKFFSFLLGTYHICRYGNAKAAK